jgi:hypothetical protein
MSETIEPQEGGAVGVACGPAYDHGRHGRRRLIRLEVWQQDGRGGAVSLTLDEARQVAEALIARSK